MSLLAASTLRLAADGAGRIMTFAIVILVARWLGPTALGEYQYAYSLAVIIAMLANFGLGLHTTAAVAREPHRRRELTGRALIAKASISLPLLAFVALTQRPLVTAFCLMAILLSLLDTICHAWRGAGEFKRDAVAASLGRAALFIAGGTALMASGQIELVAWAMAAAAAVAAISAIAVAKPIPVASGAARAFSEALPLGMASVLALLYLRVDMMLLYHLSGPAVAGEYAAAARVYESLLIIPAAIMSVAFPSMVTGGGRAVRTHAFGLLATTGLFATILLLAFSAPVVRLLFGFDSSAAPLRVLSFAVIPTFLSAYLLHDLIAAGRPGVNVVINAVALAGNVGLNLVFIPRAGASGAAAAWVLTELLICLLALAARRQPRHSIADLGARPVTLEAAP